MAGIEQDAVKVGLPPIASPDARLVILGSLPGDASLAAERYYAHPTNQFWRLLGGAIGIDLAGLDYGARLAALRSARIGLWDVIGSARRRGSLDQAIRSPAANALGDWLATLPGLRAIAFNGQAAARAGRAILGEPPGLALIDLPSSSAARTMALADKARHWSALAVYLDRAEAQSALARVVRDAKIGR